MLGGLRLPVAWMEGRELTAPELEGEDDVQQSTGRMSLLLVVHRQVSIILNVIRRPRKPHDCPSPSKSSPSAVRLASESADSPAY